MTTPTGALVNIGEIAFFAKVDGEEAYKRYSAKDDNSIIVAKMTTGDEVPALVGTSEVCTQFMENMGGYLTALTYGSPEVGEPAEDR